MSVTTRELEEESGIGKAGRYKSDVRSLFDEQTQLTIKLLMSGGLAGATGKTTTAPLARLTILYQIQGFGNAQHTPSLFSALGQVTRREGFRALWKGNMTTVVHRLPYSAVSFLTYEHSTSFLQRYLPKDQDVVSSHNDVLRRLAAGGLAGMAGTVVAYPLDLVRTRLAAQTTGTYYSGIWGSLRTIVLDEGLLGLYKGLGGSLLQVGPNLAINYCTYETLRSHWLARNRETVTPSLSGSLICGGVAGFVSSTLTFPLDLVRRRMQMVGQHGGQRQYGSYMDVVRDIMRTRGWRGFYAGIIPEYCKVMPGVAIAYSTFEIFKVLMGVEHYNAGQR